MRFLSVIDTPHTRAVEKNSGIIIFYNKSRADTWLPLAKINFNIMGSNEKSPKRNSL